MSQPVTGVLVSAPAANPYQYGLLSAATFPEPPDVRWESDGVIYTGDGCGPSGGVWPAACPPQAATYRVGFSRPANSNTLTMTLLGKNATCAGSVTVTINGGAPNDLPAIGATAQEAIPAPLREMVVVVAGGAAGGTDPCDCSTQQTFIVPDAATAWEFEMVCPRRAGMAATSRKVIRDGADFPYGEPFVVYETARCLALGFDDAEAKVRRRLALHEQWSVESYVDNSVFRETTVKANNGGTLPLARAVAALEDLIADLFGGLGVIHVPRHAYAGLAEARLIERSGTKLVTPLGNTVAVGAGYSGFDETGAPPAANQTWLYATGPVQAYRSEVFTRETFDQQRNTRLAIAERVYALTFDCLRASALATL